MLRPRPDARLRGTFAPERRASDSPMAMACLRLVTFRPERPLRSVPALRSCRARFTFAPALRPYLAITTPSRRRPLKCNDLQQSSFRSGGVKSAETAAPGRAQDQRTPTEDIGFGLMSRTARPGQTLAGHIGRMT